MAKKKRPSRIRQSLRGLEDIEKDLAKVRKNLRKFLDEAEQILSGHPWVVRTVTRARKPRPNRR